MYDHGIRFIALLNGGWSCYAIWERYGSSDVVLTLKGDDQLSLKYEMEELLKDVLNLENWEVKNLNGNKTEA